MTVHKSMLDDIYIPENSLNVVSVRLNHDKILKSDRRIDSSEEAVRFLQETMQDYDREHFVVINLDVKMKPINVSVVSVGTLDTAPVHPREVFKTAVLSNAAGVILMHNHPSGDPSPSRPDMDVTERLIKAGKVMGIQVIDHIIVGNNSYASIRSERMREWENFQVDAGRYDYELNEAREEGATYRAESSGRKSFREKVADAFVRSLEEDPKNWVKKWASNQTEPAFNAISKIPYKGINAFYLKFIEKAAGYNDPRWMTFVQAKEAGYKVPAGTKATPIEYYFMYDRLNKRSISWNEYNALSDDEKKEVIEIGSGEDRDSLDNNSRGFRMARYQLRAKEHYVFNAAQLEGVPEYVLERVVNDISPSEIVDAVARGMGVEINEAEQGRAYYSPQKDKITLPLRTQFASDYDYQSTALHELGHATGHSSRLNRDQAHWFGTPEYAYEELIAEITSCFMGEYLDDPMSDDNLDNHVAYVQGWMEAIEKDPNYLFRAIKEAEKAADYMAEKGGLRALVSSLQPISYEEQISSEADAISVADERVEYNAHSVEIAIERNRQRLSTEIDDALSGRLNRQNALMILDYTPESMRNIGMENLPILFTKKHLRNCLHEKDPEGKRHYHGLSREIIERVGEFLNDPVLIMDSLDREDSVVVVTPEIDGDGMPIIATIAANGNGQYQFEKIDTNFLTSVYGHKALDSILSYAIAEDKVLYVNEEKALELSNLAKLTLLGRLPQLGLNGIIHKSNNIVNEPYDEDINVSVKEWYLSEYPDDTVGEELFDGLTFSDVLSYLDSRGTNVSIYEYFGIVDDPIRERVFEKLSEMTGITLDEIYNRWVMAEYVDDYENTLVSENLDAFLNLSYVEDIKTQLLSASVESGFTVSPVELAELICDVVAYKKSDHEDPSYDASDDLVNISDIELAGSSDFFVDDNGKERDISVRLNLVDLSFNYVIDGQSYTRQSSVEEIKDILGESSWEDYMSYARAVMLISDYISEEWQPSAADMKQNFSNFSYIPVAYTMDSETATHGIQVAVDLENLSVIYEIDGTEIGREAFMSIESLTEAFLNPPEFAYFIERAEKEWDYARENADERVFDAKRDKDAVSIVNKDGALNIIDKRTPIGKFISGFDEEIVVAIDNSRGDAFTESFSDIETAIFWLNNPDISREEAVITKAAMVGWLSEHLEAYEDAMRHFNTEALLGIDYEDLHSWIAEHDQLYSDYKLHFGIETKLNFTLDALYERADGKRHLSPEIKALDEAHYNLADYIRDKEGKSPYEMVDSGEIDSAEEFIDDYIEEKGITPYFNISGDIVRVEESEGAYRAQGLYREPVSGKILTAEVKDEVKEVVDLIDDAISSMDNKINAIKGKETTKMAVKEKEGNRLYIELNKAFCRQTPDRFQEGKMFNIMTMPKGTVLNGRDIGGCTISPLYMNESKFNSNNMVATYYLKENEPTEIKLTSRDGSYEKVDVERLKDAVDAQQKLYREQSAEREKEKEQARSAAKTREKDKSEELE